MRNLPVRYKLMLILGLSLAGYACLLVTINWSAQQTATYIKQSSDALFPAALSSQEAEAAFQSAINRYRNAVILQDHNSLTAADQDIVQALAALNDVRQKTISNSDRQKELEGLIEQAAAIESAAQTTYPIVVNNPDHLSPETQAAVSRLAGECNRMMDGLRGLRVHVASDFRRQLSTMSANAERERNAGIVVFLAALGWAVLSIALTQRQIIHPLSNLSLRLHAIAEGDGDLTKRLKVDGNDDIGQVSASFNLFVDQLQNILQEVAASAVQLNGATAEIATSSAQQVTRAEMQKRETADIAMVMEEMAASVGEVSRSSHAAAEKARSAAATARSGGKGVQETLVTMRSVAATVEETAAQITELGARSSQIERIVAVIHDIANQTNLLALNAAIEAARAGEHGRGFAVVAGEVRGLAERTGQATQQIGEVMNLLQSGTNAAVTTMRRSQAQVQLGVDAATATGESLRLIIEAVEQGADMITRVAGATSEQSSSAAQVNENVSRIANITKQSAVGAQQSANAASELAGLASNLQGLIAKFRLEGDGAADLSYKPPVPQHSGKLTEAAGYAS